MPRGLLRYDPRWRLLPPTAGSPREAIVLRFIGLTYLVLFIVATTATKPEPSLEGRGLAVSIALVGFVGGLVFTHPRAEIPDRRRIAVRSCPGPTGWGRWRRRSSIRPGSR